MAFGKLAIIKYKAYSKHGKRAYLIGPVLSGPFNREPGRIRVLYTGNISPFCHEQNGKQMVIY